MASIPLQDTKVSARPGLDAVKAVWRDALGPGYAVAAAEPLLKVTKDAADRPYRIRR